MISLCLGCLWGLRWLSEITVPWLSSGPSYSAKDCILYSVWCIITLIPTVSYIWAAEVSWAAAGDLVADKARRAEKVLWIALAASIIKLSLVLSLTAVSEEAQDTNPYVLLETRVFMTMIFGTMLILLIATGVMVRVLQVFARDCANPAVACLA